MHRRCGVSVLHYRPAERGIDVDGVIAVAFQNAVVGEHATGARGRFDGNSRTFVSVGGRTTGASRWGVAAGRSETGQRYGGGAALHGYAGHGGCAACAGSRATGTGIWRNSSACVWIGAASGAFSACARTFSMQPAAGAIALADARSAAAAPEATLCRAAGRHGYCASTGRVRQSHFCPRSAGDDDSVAGSVSSGVTRWSYGGTEVERPARAGSFVASAAAREGFAASEAGWRWYDVGGAQERTCGAAGVSSRTVSLRTDLLRAGSFDAGRRWHNLCRECADAGCARS